MRIVATPEGVFDEKRPVWLESYDPEYDSGVPLVSGLANLTAEKEKAMRFRSFMAVMDQMMKTQIAIAIALLGLSGCTQYRWTHPNFTQASWHRDTYECEKDMRQSAYFGTGLVGQLNAADFQERCLQARGYSKVKVDQATLEAEQKLFSWAPPQCSDPDRKQEFGALCSRYGK